MTTLADYLQHAPGCRADRLERSLTATSKRPVPFVRCDDCGWQVVDDGDPETLKLSTGPGSQPARVPRRERPKAPPRRRGRPAGSGRAIPSREYLLGEYRRVRQVLDRQPTQEEFVENLTNARDGTRGVGLRTLQDARDDYEVGWPPE